MTTTIGLITTGKCEHLGLAASLARVFADADVQFTALLRGPADSITSGFVSYPAPTSSIPTVADRLVARMAAALERGGPDYVFAIDDLELDNVETPGNVTAMVRDAVVRKLASEMPTHLAARRFRERCSFHLLCPLVEAYFYGEPAALERAGARAQACIADTHLEDFQSVHLEYLAPADERGHDWRSVDRARHPKRYLRFLAQPERYREAHGGRDALAQLDWPQVFGREPPGLAFALAMFDDLADAIGVAAPFRGAAHPETARRPNGVLRNL